MTIYVHKVLQRPHLSTHTPNFTIICQNRSKRAVSVLLGFVCRLKLWRELRAFSFLRDPESFRSRQGNISFVKNTISEPLGFKIFWGRMLSDPRSQIPPPTPTTNSRLRHEFSSAAPQRLKLRSAFPAITSAWLLQLMNTVHTVILSSRL